MTEEGRFINGRWVPLEEDPELIEVREVKVQGGVIYVPAYPKKTS